MATIIADRTVPARDAEFLDMRFDLSGAARVAALIEARDPDDDFAYVVTPNVDHMVRLQRTRSDLWPQYRTAWLRLCDSNILGRLAHRAGLELPILTGSDLTAALFRDVIRPTDRIAILGGDRVLVDTLSATYGLTDIAHYDPPFGFVHDAAQVARAVEFLVGARARFSFIAVGSPQQEIVAYGVRRSGRATGVGLCIGASLEFLTGARARAPRLMRRLSLEWLFRMAGDPKRLWRRYLRDAPAIFGIFRRWRDRLPDAAPAVGHG